MWFFFKNVHYAVKTVFSLLPAIFFQLPITRTFYGFPWRLELSGADSIMLQLLIIFFSHEQRTQLVRPGRRFTGLFINIINFLVYKISFLDW